MSLDVTLLSRIQFALTIMFHYLFPPLTIGMGVVLVYLEGMYLRTREPIYETAAKFWTSLYAVSFAMGVATGIVMEFQFGTNWATYSRFVGDVFGSALAAEGIFAFFLESGFLAVLVFGWDKVTPRFHFLRDLDGCARVDLLRRLDHRREQLAADSRGSSDRRARCVNGQSVQSRGNRGFLGSRVQSVDHRTGCTHTLIGAFVLGSFFVMSISAWYLLHGKHEDFARRSFTGGLIFATIASLVALLTGHSNAQMVAKYQPAKLAAMEGHFTTGTGGSDSLRRAGYRTRDDEDACRDSGHAQLCWCRATRMQRSSGWTRYRASTGLPSWFHFLSYPHDGRAGHVLHRPDTACVLSALAWDFVSAALAAVGVCGVGDRAVYRQRSRMGHSGSGAAAVDRASERGSRRRRRACSSMLPGWSSTTCKRDS